MVPTEPWCLTLHDGLNKRNMTVMREYYSDTICHLPFGGELTGERLMQYFASLFVAFPDIQRRVEVQLTDGVSPVITRWTATGTHKQEFMGIAPTGKQFTVSGITIDRIRNGQIVEEWQEWGFDATTRRRSDIAARNRSRINR